MSPEHREAIVSIARDVVTNEHTHPIVREYFCNFLMEGTAREKTGQTLSFREGGNTRQKLRMACLPDINNRSRAMRIRSLRMYVARYLSIRTPSPSE